MPTTAAPPASQVAGMVTRWSRQGEPPAAGFLFDRGEAADVACKKSAVCASWRFVLWGALHGFYLGVERYIEQKYPQRRWPGWARQLVVFHYVCFC